MRSPFIMIGTLLLSAQLQADVNYKKLSKSQMILEGKQLSAKHENLKNKKEAWNKRKQVLITDFSKIYEDDSHFGEKNHYGKKRMEKRLEDFYSSLKTQDRDIQTKLLEVNKRINALKEVFLNAYGYSFDID